MSYIVATQGGNQRSRVYNSLAIAKGVATRRNRAFFGTSMFCAQPTSTCYEVFEQTSTGWRQIDVPQNTIPA